MPLAAIERFRDELTEWRRAIHRRPEIAFRETGTADFVAEKLTSFGLEVHRGLATTGVVASLKCGVSSRAIALRADLDALPICEKNDFAHRSQNDGTMHACGHDGHTAMLLGAARYLTEHRGFDGTVHFVFQPAEENEGGARVMIEEGLFEQFPCDAVYGMHNMPGIPEGHFAVRPGPFMASCDTFEIVLQGKGAHAAFPHTGSDTILAASSLVAALNTITSRNVSPVDQAIVSVTQFHAGDTWNVLPDTAVLRGTTRAFRKETQDLLERRIAEISDGVGRAFSVTAKVVYERRYPALVNSPAETEECVKVFRALVGEERANGNALPVMGAEDFACMLEKKPGCYVFIGNGTDRAALHNPHYDFNDALLPIGAAYWVKLARHVLTEGARAPSPTAPHDSGSLTRGRA